LIETQGYTTITKKLRSSLRSGKKKKEYFRSPSAENKGERCKFIIHYIFLPKKLPYQRRNWALEGHGPGGGRPGMSRRNWKEAKSFGT